METFLYIVFFISCIVLIGTVLLQPGKTDAGALFTSGVANTSTNPRGTASVLSKMTIGAASVFMLSALMLSLPAITGERSVLSTEGAPETTSSPAANTNTAATSPESNTATKRASEEDKSEGKETGDEKPGEKKDESK
ncbi:MAG: preprotein translocase subunit SecG [Pyrinomonadaceae bacterium]|nr:preprotein translocase subunit SecG [Pyrinomonadaceae bacterium]